MAKGKRVAEMKRNTKILLLVFFVIMFVCGLIFWADNSPIGGDGYSSSTRDPKVQLAYGFAFSLFTNDSDAYEMIDPNLKPRLDEWMNSYKSQKCVGEITYSFITAGTNLGDKITFGCFNGRSSLSFEVDDIVIKDLKVVDWGEVRETDG
jgi:hypothetical protein